MQSSARVTTTAYLDCGHTKETSSLASVVWRALRRVSVAWYYAPSSAPHTTLPVIMCCVTSCGQLLAFWPGGSSP